MPSSISSSEHGYYVRDTPNKPWLTMLAVALVVTASAFAWWDQKVRGWGYGPTYEDTPDLWAESREAAHHTGPERIVFLGSSRTLFAIDLDVFAEATGGARPIQLATVGSNPLVILDDLAADPTYGATTIVGVVPGLVAAAGGPPVSNPKKFVAHYHKRSPADRTELEMSLWMQDRFAFINHDLTVATMLDRALDLPLRKGAYAPKLPPYGYTLDRSRRGRMWDRLANDPEEQAKLKEIWIPLFTPPPRPPVFSEEEWARMMSDGWEANLERLAADVEAIRARGGRVIFIRLPSTGRVRELERQFTPRAAFWDRILEATGAPGIHFEDHAELQGFDCPEWSHLSGPDSVEFSRRLVKVMQAQGLL